MTVSYSSLVANGSSFGCFWSILFKWRGSVYKLIWRELIVYFSLYYCINLTYRFALEEHQKRIFENVRDYCRLYRQDIPISFVLAFYVGLVVKRWWEQYRLLPWPDTLALFVSAAIPGADERGRLMRRSIVRYAILAYVITLRNVSIRVKKRFPTLQHVVDAGLMMESEKKSVEMMDQKSPISKYWMPLVWATNIINRARKESLILSDHLVQTLLTELSEHRRRLGSIISYDTICIPLVYTQVVTLAVYVHSISALMSSQAVDRGKEKDNDIYFPFLTAFQFCFYIGWLKVAEVLIGPFGEDDDDFDLNRLIDRNMKAGYMIVDEMHEEHPELLRDQYWNEVVPKDLPYTVGSEHFKSSEPKGSAENYKVKESDAIYSNMDHYRKCFTPEYSDYEIIGTPMVERTKNWFQRQMQRMGSTRSSSTIYSSGLISGNDINPDIVIQIEPTISTAQNQQPRMSIYDRLVRRISMRNVKVNPTDLNNRPRIPTPDLTKEISDKNNKLIFYNNNSVANNASSHDSQSMLSTIQEVDSTNQRSVTSSTTTLDDQSTAAVETDSLPKLVDISQKINLQRRGEVYV